MPYNICESDAYQLKNINYCLYFSDCMDVSGIKRNGTTWHPSIATIGQIDCITCTCLVSNTKNARVLTDPKRILFF